MRNTKHVVKALLIHAQYSQHELTNTYHLEFTHKAKKIIFYNHQQVKCSLFFVEFKTFLFIFIHEPLFDIEKKNKKKLELNELQCSGNDNFSFFVVLQTIYRFLSRK